MPDIVGIPGFMIDHARQREADDFARRIQLDYETHSLVPLPLWKPKGDNTKVAPRG